MIEIDQLCVEYSGGHQALFEVSLQIPTGQKVAVVGANGAGKSTFLLSLVGVVSPSRGQIVVDKEALTRDTLRNVRAKVGLAFQNPDEQLFMNRVYDDVAFGPRNHHLPEQEVARRVENALTRLNITHLQERAPHHLSGGEKRSVALAGLLAMEPLVLLLDEPSSFLDPRARRALMETLAKLPQTQVIATHDLDLALNLCDRVVVLKEGRMCADGTPDAILTDEIRLHQWGLELPLCCQMYQRHP